MSENFVSLELFNGLENRVKKLEDITEHNEELLIQIDKKVDVIFEKLTNADKTEDLKLKPIEKRVEKLETGINWLWKLCASIIITGIITAIINFK